MTPDLLWYACYGPDLLAERFHALLAGGPAPGSDWNERGCADPTPPRDERARLLPHRLRFAGHSRRWGGASAVIDPGVDDAARCFARCYLIGRGQFVDLLRQQHGDAELACDLDAVLVAGRMELGGGSCALVLACGELEGHPIVACSSSAAATAASAAPSKAYLRCLIAGLRQTYHLNKQGLRRYLLEVPGIAGRYDGALLNRLYEDADEMLG